MGVKPEILSQSLNCIVNQRLLKKLCQYCKIQSNKEHKILFEDIKIKSFISKGCEKCQGTGVSGRIGIYEILYGTEELKEELRKLNPENLDYFIVNPLWRQGLKYVKEGVVSFKEYIENVRVPLNTEKEHFEKNISEFPKKVNFL